VGARFERLAGPVAAILPHRDGFLLWSCRPISKQVLGQAAQTDSLPGLGAPANGRAANCQTRTTAQGHIPLQGSGIACGQRRRMDIHSRVCRGVHATSIRNWRSFRGNQVLGHGQARRAGKPAVRLALRMDDRKARALVSWIQRGRRRSASVRLLGWEGERCLQTNSIRFDCPAGRGKKGRGRCRRGLRAARIADDGRVFERNLIRARRSLGNRLFENSFQRRERGGGGQ